MSDSKTHVDNDPRLQALCEWVAQTQGNPVAVEAASSDASFRRYFRFQYAGYSLIGMDAPPPQEDCRPFVDIAGLLAAGGVRVPRVIATDLRRGYLLLEDLGTKLFIDLLSDENADALFSDAIDSLLKLQHIPVPTDFPCYDRALLQRELDLFRDWYLVHHAKLPSDHAAYSAFEQLCEPLISSALDQPTVLVHRDYMPRNLMIAEQNPGVLDFQDAVCGPISYDPVCLFRDAFISWPEDSVDHWLREYWDRAREQDLPVPANWSAFRRAADLMGAQRHIKVIGIFARLCYRDEKPRYLEDTPRFFEYLRATFRRQRDLTPLGDLLECLDTVPGGRVH